MTTPSRVPTRRLLALLAGVFAVCGCGLLGLAAYRSFAPSAPAGPSLTIVSSLPLTGAPSGQTRLIVNAMRLRVSQAGGQACGGRYRINYKAWDDGSDAQDGWDPAAETANARQAAADPAVVAYLGPFDSGAARLSIPILDQAGPLVMISLGDNYPGLTKTFGAASGEPASYYPAGLRNYVRVNPSDDVQGAVAARYLHDRLQAGAVYLLDAGEPYGRAIADAFQAEAKAIGLTVLGRDSLDPNAANYTALMARISTSNRGGPPDAIYAAMRVEQNAGQVLKDKVAMMGDNRRVKYLGPAGLQYQALIDSAGAHAAEGLYTSQAGLPFPQLPTVGQQFLQNYDAQYHTRLAEPYAVYGYEAMSVALAAIEKVCASGGDPAHRRAIRDAVFATHDFSGALGAWSFDANGDTSLSDMTFYQYQGGAFTPVDQYK